MLAVEFYKIPVFWSLGVVGVILLASVVLSLAWKPAPKVAPEMKS